MVGSEDPEVVSDAASAAADLYQKLMHGSYIAHGKNVKIAGDAQTSIRSRTHKPAVKNSGQFSFQE